MRYVDKEEMQEKKRQNKKIFLITIVHLIQAVCATQFRGLLNGDVVRVL